MADRRLRDRLGFRPTLWATVFTIPALALLLGLGTWQMDRLQWKTALIAERQAGFNATAIPLPADDTAAHDLLWRRVQVTGVLRHDQELYLAARSMRGNVGYHVLTPLDRVDGKTVLVNRGWVSNEKKDPANRVEGQLPGTVTLEGIATPGGQRNWLTPENDARKNVWLWTDIPAMAQHLGRPLQPVVVEALATPNPGGFPIGGQTRINLPNDHLQYALTWYLLAAALVAIYVLYHRRRADPPDRA